jgi:hypothetical protein
MQGEALNEVDRSPAELERLAATMFGMNFTLQHTFVVPLFISIAAFMCLLHSCCCCMHVDVAFMLLLHAC